jgi:hypothetical protein
MNCMLEQLMFESHCMFKHAKSQGLTVPATIASSLYIIRNKYNAAEQQQQPEKAELLLPSQDVQRLSEIHNSLSKIIAPATPRTIAILCKELENKSFLHFLGPVPLIRQLSVVSVMFLITLFAIATSKDVNAHNIVNGFFSASGATLLLNVSFILCCAGLGASFAALYNANSYIANGSYDPKYDSSYWSSMILGFMAGVITVEILPPELFQENGQAVQSFGKPALAVLAGFSSNMLHRLLRRIVDTVEHLVKGEQTSIDRAKKIADKAEVSQKSEELKAQQMLKLVRLQQSLDGSTDMDQVKAQINKLIEDNLIDSSNDLSAQTV